MLAVMRLSRRSFWFIANPFADSDFAEEAPIQATSVTIETVRTPPDQVWSLTTWTPL